MQTQPPLFADGSKDPATVELAWSWLPEPPPLCRDGPLAHHKQPSPQEAGVAAVVEHGVHIRAGCSCRRRPRTAMPVRLHCHKCATAAVRDATAASPRSCSLLQNCCCNLIREAFFPRASLVGNATRRVCFGVPYMNLVPRNSRLGWLM